MKLVYFFLFSLLLLLVPTLTNARPLPEDINVTLDIPSFHVTYLEDLEELSLIDDFCRKAKINLPILPRDSIILFTNARNEKNMKEWAAHHLLLGFDIVYIFDHKSDLPLIREFENFDPRVILERCELENPVKIPLMNIAAAIAKKLKARWMIYLDADEFLILNSFTNVKDFLAAFPHADSISVNWLFFGSSHHVKEPKGLILENYTLSDKILNCHVKSFVRPSKITQAVNPHFYNIKNPKKMYSMSNQTVYNQPYFNVWEIEYHKAPAYLAHYVYQSEETYVNRKVSLPRDDNGGFRNQIPNIHLFYNEFENLDPKMKYSAQIKKFLNTYK